jgi:alpha-L-rhamnosidase
MRQYVEYLGDFADQYIVDEGLGDWVPPGSANKFEEMVPPEGPAITSTAYCAHFASIIAGAASTLDRPDEASKYRSLADEITHAFHEQFWDDDRGYYRTGEIDTYRQTSNVFPLAFGLVPDGLEDTVVDSLVTDVMETRDGHLNTGILGTKYLLSTLTTFGHVDVAVRHVDMI